MLGPLFRWFLRPSVLGAFYLLALAARAGRVDEEEKLGAQARQIASFVHGQYGAEITRIAWAIGAAAVCIGAALGAFAGLVVRLRARLAEAEPPRVAPLAARALLLTIVLHALLVLHGMADSPQLYADTWYAQGGAARTVQVLATDVLGTKGVKAIALLLILGYLAGPPRTWRDWPRRLGHAWALRTRVRSALALLPFGGALALLVGLAPGVTTVRTAHADPPPADARPNVIVLAADSLRADRITPKLTPTLDGLAARGTRFDRAYVSLPRTFPSWVTLLTGRHPHHHGIRSMFPRWSEREKDFDAVPERLAKAGYATAVVSDYAGDIFGRIDLGFQTVHTPSFDFRQLVRQRALERETPLLPVLHSRAGRAFFPVLRELSAAADPHMLTRDVVSTLDAIRDKPFFLTVFYSTAHFPYAAPAPYYARYTDPSYRGRYKYHRPVGLGQEAPADARDVAQVRALYDGAVASIDDAIAEVLAALESRGLTKNTILVVTADHGETLYESGHGQGHGDHLFGDEGTHVPFIVVDPRRAGGRREGAIVRDVDLAATLYDLTTVPAPANLDGRSVAPALEGEPLAPAFAYAETELWFTEEIPGLPSAMRLPYPGIARLTEIDPQHGDEIVLQKGVRPLTIVAKHRMIRDTRWKLLYVPARSGVRYLLYDTQSDPGETRDVAAAHPDVVGRLRAELWRWMREDRDMAERGGFLVPRDLTEEAPEDGAEGIRLGDARAEAPQGEGAP